MEHSCEQCGTLVEDGRPFCPHCRAPQISVKVAVAEAESLPEAAAEDDAGAIYEGQGALDARYLSRDTMDRTLATNAAIKAGVLGFFLGMALPFVAIVIAGAVAVYFYRRDGGIVLAPMKAARLGSAAGVVAVGIQSILFIVWIFVFHRQKEYLDSLTRFLHAVGADASAPELQASIHALFTPAGMAITILLVMAVALVLASLGGALASLFMAARGRRG